MISLTRDYDVYKEIGRGRFGVVFRCKSRATGEIYVVKSIDKSTINGDKIDSQSLTNEPKALHLLSHSSSQSSSFITRLHGVYDTPTHLHLILDYFPSPTLYTVISFRHRIPEDEARQITENLLHAIMHCHNNGVIHRDVKPENVLVDIQTKKLKLCDFGSAGLLSEKQTEIVGTPYYVAPEVLEGEGYNEKVDIWSVGVILYIMVAGFPPFHGDNVKDVFNKVLRANLRFPTRVFGSVSLSLKDLLRRMLCKDVSTRFSAHEALRHPWVTSGNGVQSTTGAHLMKAEPKNEESSVSEPAIYY